MKIEKKITDACNYGDKRNTGDIKYVVLLDLGERPTPHYHVCGDKVYQIVPDNMMSATVNGARLSKDGVYHGICTKYNSVSIGINNNLSDKDSELCLHLIMTLLQRYDLRPDDVIRLKDITGEISPEIWEDNNKWTDDVINKLNDMLNPIRA